MSTCAERRRRRAAVLLAGAAIVLLAPAGVAAAQEAAPPAEAQPAPAPPLPEIPEIPEVPEIPEIPELPAPPVRPSQPQVIFGSPLTIEENEVAKDVVVFGGPLTIRGRVIGDAAAFGGAVTVSGQVTGDLVAVGGPVTLEATAEILGDVVPIGGHLTQHPEARVMGTVESLPVPSFSFGDWSGFAGWPWRHGHVNLEFSPWSRIAGVSWQVFGVLLLGLVLSLILLLAPRPVRRIDRRVAAEPWKSGLVGLLAQILFLPVLFLVLAVLLVSVIGIPFCLLIPFAILALFILALVGYTAVTFRVGEIVRSRFGWAIGSPFLVLVLGLAALHVWEVIGAILDFGWGPMQLFSVMFALFGCMVTYVAFTIGLGGVLLTRFGSAEGWGERAQLPPPPPAGEGAQAGYSAPPEPERLPEPESPPQPPRDDWDS